MDVFGGIIDWSEVVTAGNQVVQSLGIVVTGVWAYFRFLRGRTFAYRAALDLTTTLIRSGSRPCVYVVLRVTNAGLSRLPLNSEVCGLELHCLASPDWNNTRNVRWTNAGLYTPVLQQHRWIEPGETVTDEVILPVPPAGDPNGWTALRTDVEIWAAPSPTRRNWRALRHPIRNRSAPLPRRHQKWHANHIVHVAPPGGP